MQRVCADPVARRLSYFFEESKTYHALVIAFVVLDLGLVSFTSCSLQTQRPPRLTQPRLTSPHLASPTPGGGHWPRRSWPTWASCSPIARSAP